MAVYREKRGPNRLLVALGLAAVLILLAGLVFLLLPRPPAGETPRQRAQAGLRTVNEALDVFAVEYPKEQAGSPAGAQAALTRARHAFDSARPALAAADAPAAQTFDAALRALEAQAAARAPVAETLTATTKLRSDIRAWLETR
jgi:hypothetical protein